MDLVRELRLPAPPTAVFGHVDDLTAYPAWMSLVGDVEAFEVVDGQPPAWSVLLQAQVGPFTRSKRLRMARVVHEPDRRVVFERAETDGREHAIWRLESTLASVGDGETDLRMHLHYGGRLWGAVLERVLDGQVSAGSERLLALVSAGG